MWRDYLLKNSAALSVLVLSCTLSLVLSAVFYFWFVAMWLKEMSNEYSKQAEGCSSKGEKMTDPAASTSASQRSLFWGGGTPPNILLRKVTEGYTNPLNNTNVFCKKNPFSPILLGLPLLALLSLLNSQRNVDSHRPTPPTLLWTVWCNGKHC